MAVQPIPFSVAPAQRTGLIVAGQVTLNNSYSSCSATLTGLGTGAGSEYEDIANSVVLTVNLKRPSDASFGLYYQQTWRGGPVNFHGHIDPPPAFVVTMGDLAPVGSVVQVTFDLGSSTFSVGISGSLNP